MTKAEKQQLEEMIATEKWGLRNALRMFLDSATIEEPKETRTDSQHRGLFLWFSMIEKEAENAGITWDMVVKHTHQLKITKEGLHGMCKTLQEALWGTKSTKEIAKTQQLDVLIDHFTDLFGKVGLEVPPFPYDPKKLADYKVSESELR